MVRTIKVRSFVSGLAMVAVAVSAALPSVGSAAQGEPGHREKTGSRGPDRARAVASPRMDTGAARSIDLLRLAKAQRGSVDDTWMPGTMDAGTTGALGRHWQNRVPRKKMPRSVGKLFTLDEGATIGECSAFAVRDPKFPKKRSFVVTAGHCLVDPKTKNWVNIAQFYPKYYGKRPKPYGRWDAKQMLVYDKWYNKGNWRFDVGVIKVERHKKKQIVDKVGGNRLAYGAKPKDKRVRFVGYPAAGKYDGKFPYQCVGPARRHKDKHWMAVLPCATRGGASGGPWFKRMLDRNTGVVSAAASRATFSGKRVVTAPTFRKSLRRIAFKNDWR